MSDNHQFVIDLNESLYFESGQEISELVNISLDPNISVRSENDTVLIRGHIELQGEYQKSTEVKEEDPLELQAYHSRRYVEKVEEVADGLAHFSHSFPLEISVPADRVDDLNQIMVKVEWFDYELPSHNHLVLTSQIAIEGIQDLRQKQTAESTVEDSLDLTDPEQEAFAFEIKIRDEKEAEEEKQPKHHIPKINEQPLLSREEDEQHDHYELESQSLAEVLTRSASVEEEPSDLDVETEVDEEVVAEVVDTRKAEVEEEDLETEATSDTRDEEEEINDVSYLAQMFQHKEDEAEVEFTRLKICIVQEDDTLETIAERYEVPKLQLLKQNRLEGDDLTEGQLLLIPARKPKQQQS